MSLQVVSFSTYRTGGFWRGSDHDAHKFIEAIKDRPVNGYARILVRGLWHSFDNTNRHSVVLWFAQLAADYLEANHAAAGALLVPVPGSKVDVHFAGMSRVSLLAHAVANELHDGTLVRDVLRWREPMPSAHEKSGTRNPDELFHNLLVTENLEKANVTLVDDVMTSGGHLQACAAKLRESGATVQMALVAGRADGDWSDDAFAVRTEDIGDYEPF
jgi:predicted amidophosphoribosyltransferase